MELTPNDIRHFDFPAKVRGYDKEAVDNFKEQVALMLETLKTEHLRLSLEVESLRNQVGSLKTFEDAIKNAATEARRTADQTVAKAKKEAEEIVKKAGDEIDGVLAERTQRVAELEGHIQKLELTRKAYLAKLQQLIQSHLEWFQDIAKTEFPDTSFVSAAPAPRASAPKAATTKPSAQRPSTSDSDRIQVTDSKDVTAKTRETFASQPSKREPIHTEEANAADKIVEAALHDAAKAAQPADFAIDPELAAALNNYQRDTTAGQKEKTSRGKRSDSSTDKVPMDKAEGTDEHEPVNPKFSSPVYEHATVNIDAPISEPPQQAPEPPKETAEPDSLAAVLDNVVHKFEEEMDKAAKS